MPHSCLGIIACCGQELAHHTVLAGALGVVVCARRMSASIVRYTDALGSKTLYARELRLECIAV